MSLVTTLKLLSITQKVNAESALKTLIISKIRCSPCAIAQALSSSYTMSASKTGFLATSRRNRRLTIFTTHISSLSAISAGTQSKTSSSTKGTNTLFITSRKSYSTPTPFLKTKPSTRKPTNIKYPSI